MTRARRRDTTAHAQDERYIFARHSGTFSERRGSACLVRHTYGVAAPDLLSSVLAHAAPGQVSAVVEIPARDAEEADWPEWVGPEMRQALAKRGISKLWSHQAEAAQLLHDGVHTVIATGTGSGKSLAAWMPALNLISARNRSEKSTGRQDESAAPHSEVGVVSRNGKNTAPRSALQTNGKGATPQDRKATPQDRMKATRQKELQGNGGLANIRYRPTILYLAPTKALAADQYAGLSQFAGEVDPRIGITTADGDAEAPAKRWAREYADVVLSNPDFLQHVMLASHDRWARLWRGLAMVVIDEFHSYRGVFGANVAATVRRLMRIAAHYGASPTLAFLSATSGDPAETARRFLGESFGPVQAIERDGSPRGQQWLVLWKCRETAALRGESRIDVKRPTIPLRAANTEAGELMGTLVAGGAQTLTFVRSRAGTERVAEIAREWLAVHAPDLAKGVAAYRGGYLPEDRRALEDALRSGDLRALATTNALELGIDMSGLDAVIVTGWPGTQASFAQQIGRAGRAGKAGVAVFIGRDNPLDQYLLAHPEAITQTPVETNVFDPTNPHVLVPHICAAAAELPLTEADALTFGLESTTLFDNLASDGLLRRRPRGWFWNTALGASAHDMVSLRGDGGTIFIVDGDSGVLLGTVDASRADTTVFPGAIYLHQGMAYMVEGLDGDVALVHRHRDEEIRTYAAQSTSVRLLSTDRLEYTDFGTWARGEVLVTSQVTGYDIRRADDGLYLGRMPLTMPVRELHTSGTWWTLSSQALERTKIDTSDLPGALHAAEHTSIGILPLLATCDRWDLGGLSTVQHGDTGTATVIVHDAVPGGSGCSLRGFEHGRTWMDATLSALEGCPCSNGCPRCVQSPKCGNNNEPLSKSGAIKLLRTVTRGMPF